MTKDEPEIKVGDLVLAGQQLFTENVGLVLSIYSRPKWYAPQENEEVANILWAEHEHVITYPTSWLQIVNNR